MLPPAPPVRAVVEPLSPSRYKIQFTASGELRDKLERLQDLMDSDLAAVIEAAVTEKLERLEAKRFAETKSPRKTLEETDTSPKSRYLPAAVRRFVSRRDGNQCRFVSETGRRCPERRGLEFHHEEPFGRGGGHEPGYDLAHVQAPQHLFRRAGVWERVDEEVSEKRRGGVRDRAPVRHLGADERS